jgi:hypothetical protein
MRIKEQLSGLKIHSERSRIANPAYRRKNILVLKYPILKNCFKQNTND